MWVCEPFDILDVGMILQVRALEVLDLSTRDVGEWCLRDARHARALYVW